MSSISSVSSAPPVSAVVQSPQTSPSNAPDPTADSDGDDASAAQPVISAPLPPGQGTRVDQIV